MSQRSKAIHYASQMAKNGSVYVWSGQGEKLTEVGGSQFIYERETNKTSAEAVFQFIGQEYLDKKLTRRARCFDCSGLVIESLKYAGVLPDQYDATADDLFRRFPDPKVMAAGDLVFKVDKQGHAYHVGILKDLKTVIEAKGRKYGVVESPLDHSWNGVRTPY